MSDLADIYQRLGNIEASQGAIIAKLDAVVERELECRREVRDFLRGNGKPAAGIRLDRLEQFQGAARKIFWSLIGGLATAAGGAIWIIISRGMR